MSRINQIEYTMVVEPAEDENGKYYCSYFPDLPGCTTMASTLKELDAHAKEAVNLYIDALKQTGQRVPMPSVEIRKVRVKAAV